MGEIWEIGRRQKEIVSELCELWELSVRSTHHFLGEEDIEMLKPFVVQGVQHIERLFCFREEDASFLAFMGIQGDKLEMLFVHPDYSGKGIGKQLVEYAIGRLGVRKVDVNEQNPQAAGFYKHLGFSVFSRSEQDEQGNSFPILHMKLQ